MRETILSFLFCAVAWLVAVYLAASFVLWQFNAALWSMAARGNFVGAAASGICVLALLTYLQVATDEE